MAEGRLDADTVRGEAENVLTLRRVLQASARSAPEILAALARERQADGRLLSVLVVELHETEGERPTSDELLALLRGRIANWWMPDKVYVLPQMPLQATGKIDKLRLRMDYG